MVVRGELSITKCKRNLNIVIQKLAKEYRELVRKEIEDYQPILSRDLTVNMQDEESEGCCVYLMIDHTNNFHKIGVSNKPDWREKTLQGEKPTIELLASKKYISRKIAAAFEKALHMAYDDKRIRGEWFKLNPSELEEIKRTLSE